MVKVPCGKLNKKLALRKIKDLVFHVQKRVPKIFRPKCLCSACTKFDKNNLKPLTRFSTSFVLFLF